MGGMMKPPDESTGSMITAETVSGPSRRIVARSSPMRRAMRSASLPPCRSRKGWGGATFTNPGTSSGR